MPRVHHYFERQPEAASARRLVRLDLPDLSLSLLSDAGVFSVRRLDPGTAVLLELAPPPPPDGDVLDLGCGYGPITAVLARRSPGATVWAVDVNERGLELVRLNAERLGLRNVRAVEPGAVPPGLRFAAIYSNPPIRIGRARLMELLRTWLDRLRPDGSACLVVHRNLGSDSLMTRLVEEGYRCERIGSRRGYRVLRVRPPERSGP